MEFKGTKGEWHQIVGGFGKRKDTNMIQIYATNDDLEMICKVYKDEILQEPQDFEANARLIAAAPEMLKVLQVIAASKGVDTFINYYPEIADSISDVINKATNT